MTLVELASIGVDSQHNNTQRTDEVSKNSSATSHSVQSRMSDTTTDNPVEGEALIRRPQNEGSASTNSSLIPGHDTHSVNQDIDSGSKEKQEQKSPGMP